MKYGIVLGLLVSLFRSYARRFSLQPGCNSFLLSVVLFALIALPAYGRSDDARRTNGRFIGSNPLCASIDGACVSTGPRLASVDSERGVLLNALLGNLLDSSLSLSVVDWNAIAQGDVGLVDYLDVLQTDLSVSTPHQALDANATLFQLFDAAADVAQADGNTALVDALNVLKAGVSGLSATIRLGDLLEVTFPTGAFTNVRLNALDLVSGVIQLYNYENVATTPSPVTISGSSIGLGSVLNNVDLYAQVVEPPVYSCGPAGTTLHSAAIRLKLNLDLVDLALDLSALETALGGVLGQTVTANGTIGDLELYAEVARADATIQTIDALAQSITLDATPGVVDLYLGQIPDAVFFNRAVPVNPATDLDFGLIGDLSITVGILPAEQAGIEAKTFGQGQAPVNSMLVYNGPYPETQTANTGASFIANLVNTVVTALDVQLDGSLGALLDPLVNGTILPPLKTAVQTSLTPALTTILTSLVDPVLELLGIRLGEMDVTVYDVFESGDSDNDGIPDSVEDTDCDGDPDNDDADNDGFPNYLDIDSDNDGITDNNEAGVDLENPVDTDGDGLPDYLDIDTDGDGVPDAVEAQSSAGYTVPAGVDVDSDGLFDVYDADTGSADPVASAGLTPYDYDADTTPDHFDADSDDDGAGDLLEGHDMNFDGVINNGEAAPLGSDADADGLDDGFEGEFGASYTPGQTLNATNGVGSPPGDLPNLSNGSDDPAEPDFRDGAAVLPVDLISFDATLDGTTVHLIWQTASETNNAGFFVEMVGQEAALFEQHGFVGGFGTTEQPHRYEYRVEALDPGAYTFRLKQVDFDGTFAYSPEVEVIVEMTERFVVEPAYPNPFNPRAQLQFAVRHQQRVRVDLYDMLGRRVKGLYSGAPQTGHMQTVHIDGSELPSGLYLVRVQGEQFVETQQVLLVK